jgi:hypothetical protein
MGVLAPSVARTREGGLLTTASDELGIGPFSAVGFASAPPQVRHSKTKTRLEKELK